LRERGRFFDKLRASGPSTGSGRAEKERVALNPLRLSLSKPLPVRYPLTMAFYTYLLRCSDGSYYVGHTDDLEARMAQHQSGALGGYSSKRLPVSLLWSEKFQTRDDAFAAERKLKGWSRAKKEALIAGDWDGLRVLSRSRGPSTSSG